MSSSSSHAEIKRIAIAVVDCAGHYVIGQRPEGVPLAGLWEFPGGKVESGEEIFAAAERETLEEAGLVVVADILMHVQEFAYDHGRVQLHFVLCRVKDSVTGTDLPAVNLPFRWVPHAALAEYSFPEGNREILAILRQSR